MNKADLVNEVAKVVGTKKRMRSSKLSVVDIRLI